MQLLKGKAVGQVVNDVHGTVPQLMIIGILKIISDVGVWIGQDA